MYMAATCPMSPPEDTFCSHVVGTAVGGFGATVGAWELGAGDGRPVGRGVKRSVVDDLSKSLASVGWFQASVVSAHASRATPGVPAATRTV